MAYIRPFFRVCTTLAGSNQRFGTHFAFQKSESRLPANGSSAFLPLLDSISRQDCVLALMQIKKDQGRCIKATHHQEETFAVYFHLSSLPAFLFFFLKLFSSCNSFVVHGPPFFRRGNNGFPSIDVRLVIIPPKGDVTGIGSPKKRSTCCNSGPVKMSLTMLYSHSFFILCNGCLGWFVWGGKQDFH